MNGDPAPGAAIIGSALSTIVWILLSFFTPVGEMTTEAIAALTGASATIFGAILYYLIPGQKSPVG